VWVNGRPAESRYVQSDGSAEYEIIVDSFSRSKGAIRIELIQNGRKQTGAGADGGLATIDDRSSFSWTSRDKVHESDAYWVKATRTCFLS